MRYITQEWIDDKDGYMFCIQRLQEMLFHYSDDIVKAPVHNIQTLLEEYIETEKSVINRKVGQYQLDVLAQEIKHSLLSDPILEHKYEREIVEEIANALTQNQTATVHYLYNRILKKEYYDSCINYLKENTMKANHKSEIEKGLRAWIASAIWHGYTPEYIYRYLRMLFEMQQNNPQDAMENFWSRFNFQKYSYNVYFVFYSRLKPYRELLQERLHISFEDDGHFDQIKKKQNSFVGYMNVKALDDYGAMSRAYSALKIFLRFFKVFTNGSDSVMGKNGFVFNCDTAESVFWPVTSLGYKNIEPEPNKSFVDEIDCIVLGCQEKDRNVYSELNKIVDLHNSALKQNDLNDAFLNLWSVLEVIGNGTDEKSKIDGVLRNIVPILQNDYFECLFYNIVCDLKNNLSKDDFIRLLDNITEFDDELYKIAGFIFGDNYEALREQYFANELKKYANIRNKIYILYQSRKDTQSIWNMSKRYCQRIQWHLYRLYRLRNSIVHAGESHKRIQVLGEHLHIYVDRAINEIMIKLAKDSCLITIQDVLIDTKFLLRKKEKGFVDRGQVDMQAIELLLKDYFIYEE